MKKQRNEFDITLSSHFFHLEVWRPNIGRTADEVNISGVLLTDIKGTLSLTSQVAGNSAVVKQNLQSPRIAKLYPENILAESCRFSSEFITCKKGDVLQLCFEPELGESVIVAQLKFKATYDSKFYQTQKTGSRISAKHYFSYLFSLIKPKSLVDFGCGVGTWIKQANEMGVESVLGLDGVWTQSIDNYFDDNIIFQEADLNNIQMLTRRFDLAMSLEVAEHLKPESSQNLVETLCRTSNVVMFGAAYLGQPGKDHINCQKHSFWAELFNKQGYKPFDLFRSKFWGHKEVEPWYQQNTFCYIKENTMDFKMFIDLGIRPMNNLAFMDVVHPWLYNRYLK